MRERRGFSRVLPLLALALLVGSALALLPFPTAFPTLAPLRFLLFGLAATAALLAWGVAAFTQERIAQLLAGVAALLLCGLCFASSAVLARRFWYLRAFHAEAKEACRGIQSPWRKGAPYTSDAAREDYRHRMAAVRERILEAAEVPEEMVDSLGLDCDAEGPWSSFNEGGEIIWSIDEQGRLR